MRHTRLFISHTVHIAPQYVLSFSYHISYALSSPYLILPSFLLRIRLLPSMRRAALCFMNRLLFCFTSHPYFFRAHRILYTCFPMLILPHPYSYLPSTAYPHHLNSPSPHSPLRPSTLSCGLAGTHSEDILSPTPQLRCLQAPTSTSPCVSASPTQPTALRATLPGRGCHRFCHLRGDTISRSTTSRASEHGKRGVAK